MLFQWTKRPLLALVCGLCLSLQAGANAQSVVETFNVTVPGAVATQPLSSGPDGMPAIQALPPLHPLPNALPEEVKSPTITSAPAPIASTSSRVRVALLLPLRSSTLGRAANAVRDGFFAAHAHQPEGVDVTLVETGDAPGDVVAGYRAASAGHEIVVGPLSRTGVAALARSGEVMRPTIALSATEESEGGLAQLPPHMLVMGLSIEDEARQAADWARRDHATSTAYVVHTRTAWQRRAARAFASHWERSGMAVRTVELNVIDGFLDPTSMQQLKKRLQENGSAFLFAALDAGQARQLRESVGRQFPLYGTSQLNPVALPDRPTSDPLVEMEGAYLLDIPWQLQADHPAVMVYPRQAMEAEQRRSADLERLYALGIDAYRVARRIAAQHTNFELDGVTGRLTVRFDRFGPHFERTAQQAVFRDGNAVPDGAAR